MDTFTRSIESFLDLILRMPVLVGILGSWAMTQTHKWLTPPHMTDAQRVYRTRQMAFMAGVVFTVLAYMNPEVRTAASATSCSVLLGMGWCTPPLKAFVLAPIVGVAAIWLWDVLMHVVETRWPEFYRKYISGKRQSKFTTLPDGTELEIITDSKGRFIKVRVLGCEDTERTLVLGTDPTVPRRE